MKEILELPTEPIEITINYDLNWNKLVTPSKVKYDLCFDKYISINNFPIQSEFVDKKDFRVKFFRYPGIKSVLEGVRLMSDEHYQPIRIEHLAGIALKFKNKFKFWIPAPGSIHNRESMHGMPYIVCDARALGMGMTFMNSKPAQEAVFAGYPIVYKG